jgi:hypothetical protein
MIDSIIKLPTESFLAQHVYRYIMRLSSSDSQDPPSHYILRRHFRLFPLTNLSTVTDVNTKKSNNHHHGDSLSN